MNSSISAKRDDLVELARDLRLAHAEDGAVQEDVLAAGEVGMKPGAHLEQRSDAAVNLRFAFRRLGDARQDLQQRRLAGAVAADHADDLARANLVRDALQGPDRLRGGKPARRHPAERTRRERGDAIAQRVVLLLAGTNRVPLAEPGNLDGDVSHSQARSTIDPSTERKYATPLASPAMTTTTATKVIDPAPGVPSSAPLNPSTTVAIGLRA